MKLSEEDARDIVHWDHPDWNQVGELKLIAPDDDWVLYEGVFEHKSTGLFYRVTWRDGEYLTPFELDKEVEFDQVVSKEVTITKWVKA